jgi:hypothetical protein
MDAAVQRLRSEGFPVKAEALARLSPLVFDHINLLGRYSFALPDAVQRAPRRSRAQDFAAVA